MNIYEIPVNFKVIGKNSDSAEKSLITFLNMSLKEFATENRVDEYELIEVLDEAEWEAENDEEDMEQLTC